MGIIKSTEKGTKTWKRWQGTMCKRYILLSARRAGTLLTVSTMRVKRRMVHPARMCTRVRAGRRVRIRCETDLFYCVRQITTE